MAQAFDEKGNPLGPELFGDTPQEALESVLEKHMDAAEYRVRKLRESIPDEEKFSIISDRLERIEAKLDALIGPESSPPTEKTR